MSPFVAAIDKWVNALGGVMTLPMRAHSLIWILVASVVLAGCATPEETGNGGTTPPPTGGTTPMTPTPTTNETFDPAPMGSALTAADIAAMAAAFTDAPLMGGQEPWPGHLVKWVNNETFILLHFDNDDPLQSNKLLWMGIGVKGVFCSQDQPGPEFTHFHKKNAATYAEGHGGEPGVEGYWLLHVAVLNFTSPFGQTGHAGVDHAFGPTPPTECDTVPSKDFEAPGAGNLTAADLTLLRAALSDNVLRGGQEPWPGHLTKWVNEDVFLLVHFDDDAVGDNAQALWTGIGVRSKFCDSARPSAEFTHHHSAWASEYAAGHGGKAGQPGYWLLHLNVKDFESPFGATGHPGIHEGFGPTPPPTC